MIGLDLGTEKLKWFDGKRFGEGTPSGNAPLTVGLSSHTVLVRRAAYPICKGANLKRLILSDVTAELSLDPSQVAVSYCLAEKRESGCEFFVFVEKREFLKEVEGKFRYSGITLDLLGGLAAVGKLYGSALVVDAGAAKVAFYLVQEGRLRHLEVLRGGFNYYRENLSLLLNRLSPFLSEGGKVLLIGGGALDDDFKEALSPKVDFEVPNFPPFGELAPLYFNAYGLYHFKSSTCKAYFSRSSLFDLEFLQKNRSLLLKAAAAGLASLFFITVGQLFSYLSAKKEYYALKGALKEELSKVLGEPVLAPEIQVPQKLQELKELREFLLADRPPLLYYLHAVSSSVSDGVKVLSVEGSVRSGSFTVEGRAENGEALNRFVENLKKRFKKVSLSSNREVKGGVRFKLELSGVKVGA